MTLVKTGPYFVYVAPVARTTVIIHSLRYILLPTQFIHSTGQG
jgi:hypothetical protein